MGEDRGRTHSFQETHPGRILIVDDEPAIRDVLTKLLGGNGYHIREADDARTAKDWLLREKFDVVVTDLAMPGESGLELIRWGRDQRIDAMWIILTGSGHYEDAITAVRLGACDYLCKPFPDLQSVRTSIGRAVDRHRRVNQQKHRLRSVSSSNRQLHCRMEELESALQRSSVQTRDWSEEMERARLIEQSLLPRCLPHSDTLSTYAWYHPSGPVGGDLYDVFPVDRDHLAFYVADAAGHGVSAAMLAMLLKPALQPLDSSRGPAEVLRSLAAQLHRHAEKASMFVSMAYGMVNTSDLTLRFASAGHPPTLLDRPGMEIQRLAATGAVIGVDADSQYREVTLQLRMGDRLLLFSDGAVETRHPERGWFGEDRLADWLLSSHTLPTDRLIPECATALRRFAGGNAFDDDITLLLLSADGLRQSIIYDDLLPSDDRARGERSPQPVCRFDAGMATPPHGVALETGRSGQAAGVAELTA